MSLAIRASVTRLPVSPRKARLVVDVVRGMPVEVALSQLQYLPNKSSEYVAKLIKSAAANAEIAKQRAEAVRDLLKSLGLTDEQIELQKPADIQGGSGPQARRVEVTLQ